MVKGAGNKPGQGPGIPVRDEVWVQAIITEKLEAHGALLEERMNRVLAATSFQTLMEHTVDQLAAIATPLANLSPRRGEPNQKQLARLRRIKAELDRVAETRPFEDVPVGRQAR